MKQITSFIDLDMEGGDLEILLKEGNKLWINTKHGCVLRVKNIGILRVPDSDNIRRTQNDEQESSDGSVHEATED